MDALLHDVRSAIRSLTKARGFAAVAILVFALGIGINTALFSIVNAVFFRPLPVNEPERLVYLYEFVENRSSFPVVMDAELDDFKRLTDVFADVTAHTGFQASLIVEDETVVTRAEHVRANYFDVLGVPPHVGRWFSPDADRLDTGVLSVVISHRLWTRRFGSDPAVIGRPLRICCRYLGGGMRSEDDFTIIGVAPAGFHGISDPWTPSDIWVTSAHLLGVPGYAAYPIARLAPGVTFGYAREAVRNLGANLIAEQKSRLTPAQLTRWLERRFDALPATDVRMPFNPAAELVPAQLAAAMTVVVAVVLLIAATNIAGLLMARGVTRKSETAVRRVLGARALRLGRQLVAESILLASLGGALGVLLATWLLALFRTFTPDRFSIQTPLDLRVLAFTAAVCVIAGFLTGLAPLIQAMRIDVLSALPGNATGGFRQARGRLRHIVLIPQVGLCLVLLVAAGLQVRALMRMELADLGYETHDRIALSIGLRPDPGEKAGAGTLEEKRAARARAFYRQLRAGIDSVTGLTAVSLSSAAPTSIPADTGAYDAIGQEAYLAGARKGVGVGRMTVDTNYFRTIGMRVIAGRHFDERDAANTPLTVIVNETLARRLWPGLDPIGRTLTLSNNFPADNEKVEWREVVGVVNDIDPVLLDRGDVPLAYLAMGQQWQPSASYILAHVPGGRGAAIEQLKRVAGGADLFSSIYSVRTLNQLVADILYPRRMAAGILAVSALVGLMLAVVGLYGVISYAVGQRRHEIGVRATLGASRADIVLLVLREGGVVIAAGTALGAALSYAAVQLARGRIAELPPFDPITVAVVPVLLAIVVLAACYIPARRAARVDPLESLRAL